MLIVYTLQLMWSRTVGVTYEEDKRRTANQSHGGGQFAFVSTTVGSCRFLRVFHQAKLLDAPLSHLERERDSILYVNFVCICIYKTTKPVKLHRHLYRQTSLERWRSVLPWRPLFPERLVVERRTPSVLVPSEGRLWHQTEDNIPYSAEPTAFQYGCWKIKHKLQTISEFDFQQHFMD